MDFILVARTEQRLTGRTRLGNKGAKWVGVTRFAAYSPVANLYRDYFPSRPLHVNAAERVTPGACSDCLPFGQSAVNFGLALGGG